MHIVLLSGGSGKRLWPLSNEIRSKQFIKIFDNGAGEFESMVQRIYKGLKISAPDAGIVVSTCKEQTSALYNQLGEDISVCVEPTRKDTFPAISLACAYLKDVLSVSDDEPVVVCPVDPYVEQDYFNLIAQMGTAVETETANLLLMGIKPTYPSEKYGYIVADEACNVKAFKEKPDINTAIELIEKNAWWNGGVFAFKLGYLMDKSHSIIEYKDYYDLKERYCELSKISFDYAVSEKEESIKVFPFYGMWKDLGTWNTFSEAMKQECIGNVLTDNTCSNTHIVNELDIPILGMGLKNIVVAASSDGILVADKGSSSYMKPYVDKIEYPVMYAEKSWGNYRVLDIEKGSITVKVTLLAEHSMNYHSHEKRSEIWTVVKGCGTVVLDGKKQKVTVGDVIHIPIGCKHTICAETDLVLTEVQFGDIDVGDKIKHVMEMQ